MHRGVWNRCALNKKWGSAEPLMLNVNLKSNTYVLSDATEQRMGRGFLHFDVGKEFLSLLTN